MGRGMSTFTAHVTWRPSLHCSCIFVISLVSQAVIFIPILSPMVPRSSSLDGDLSTTPDGIKSWPCKQDHDLSAFFLRAG